VQRAIETRKKANERYDYMDAAMADERRKMLIANFESSTTQKIERRMKNVMFSQSKASLIYIFPTQGSCNEYAKRN
jgi:hypothetical protein